MADVFALDDFGLFVVLWLGYCCRVGLYVDLFASGLLGLLCLFVLLVFDTCFVCFVIWFCCGGCVYLVFDVYACLRVICCLLLLRFVVLIWLMCALWLL